MDWRAVCAAKAGAGVVSIDGGLMVHAIIDFAADSTACTRLEFVEPVAVLRADTLDAVEGVLRNAQEWAEGGAWVAGFVGYEAAPAFDTALRVRGGASTPLVWFAVFDQPRCAPSGAGDVCSASLDLQVDAEFEAYAERFTRIHNAIARGEIYQANCTLRLRGVCDTNALALYDRLRTAQPAGYCAYIDFGAQQVLSLSPELFFRRDGARLTTQPMKGTRARGRHVAEDEALARELRESAKDRAENLMIVDLLRNDLSRLARRGSVTVPQRYALQRLPTVWQMTSTVSAEIDPGCGLFEIFRALFPCGSITGAPKVKAMQWIAELEDSARGPYCGAIGLLKPGGDAVFNVAIRTVVVDARRGEAVCGVGSGIVWDSRPDDEYAEVLLKGRFLHAAPWPRFGLIETMRLQHGEVMRLARHMARLEASARYFDFSLDAVRWRGALENAARAHAAGLHRLRLCLHADGALDVDVQPFVDAVPATPRSFVLADAPVRSDDVRLFHKTTLRQPYEGAATAHPDAFDVLLWNERGEVTEFTRGNLVLELDGRLLTPALDGGLLAGCLRDELLECGQIAEATLTLDELARATCIWFINSLRGALRLKWDRDVC